jgi:hypothetical protein
MPESPTLILGRDILDHMHTTILMALGKLLCLPLMQMDVDPEIWFTQGKIGKAMMPPLLKCTLKTPQLSLTRDNIF